MNPVPSTDPAPPTTFSHLALQLLYHCQATELEHEAVHGTCSDHLCGHRLPRNSSQWNASNSNLLLDVLVQIAPCFDFLNTSLLIQIVPSHILEASLLSVSHDELLIVSALCVRNLESVQVCDVVDPRSSTIHSQAFSGEACFLIFSATYLYQALLDTHGPTTSFLIPEHTLHLQPAYLLLPSSTLFSCLRRSSILLLILFCFLHRPWLHLLYHFDARLRLNAA